MDKQVDFKTIAQFTSQQFGLLPYTVCKNDLDFFTTILYRIDKLCADNPKAYRLLMPFHTLVWGDQCAWAKDFTWDAFIKDAIESDCTFIKKHLTGDFPCIDFCDKSGNKCMSIKLVSDD